MITFIQVIIILVALIVATSALAGKQTHTAKAWKKLVLCLLALAMIIAVLFPESTNIVAHAFGVGRGADLLLYILTLAFIGYVLNNYLHQQKEQETLHKLARRLALYEAKKNK